MLSYHFNLLDLIMWEDNCAYWTFFFLMSCIFSSLSHYSLGYLSFPGQFVRRANYMGRILPFIPQMSCSYFPELSFIILTLLTAFLLYGQYILK